MGWKKVTLKEISEEVKYGYTESASKEKIGPRFLRITDIAQERLEWGNVPYCKIPKKKIEIYKLLEGDIVIARTGATTGYAKRIKFGIPEAVFASYLVRFRINSAVDNRFVGALIESNIYKEYIKSIVGGAAQPNANAQLLGSFEINLPDLPTQQKIASILSAYDDLIENNTRRIKLLEEMAQTIYKEWFVNFRFPGHEKVKFVDSSLGKIPEGWEAKKLGDIADVRGGKRLPKGEVIIDEKTSHPYIRIVDLNFAGVQLANLNFISNEVFSKISRYTISNEDIYISIAGTIGYVGIIPKELEGANLTENCAKIIDFNNSVSKHFLLYYLRSTEGQSKIRGMTGGASQPKLALYRIKEIELIVPARSIIEFFENKMDSIGAQIENLKRRNSNLSKTRDLLLPKLMSGEVEV